MTCSFYELKLLLFYFNFFNNSHKQACSSWRCQKCAAKPQIQCFLRSLSWSSHNCCIDCTAADWLNNLPNAGYIIFFNPLEIEWVKWAYEAPVLHNKTPNTSISPGIRVLESLHTHIRFTFSSHFKLRRSTFHSVVSSSSACARIDFSLCLRNKCRSLRWQNIFRAHNDPPKQNNGLFKLLLFFFLYAYAWFTVLSYDFSTLVIFFTFFFKISATWPLYFARDEATDL